MKQEEIVVKIERIVPNGYGLAFADGMTIFVSLAVKGDTLKVRLREKKGKLAFAEIIEIIEDKYQVFVDKSIDITSGKGIEKIINYLQEI